MSGVRVRFAPSPTGKLHVGGLRTALFNYLFARGNGGRFVLRIEDTDRERYVEGAEAEIIDTLSWAGIEPDEGPDAGGAHGPYRQSERLHLYREAADRLLAAGHAYKCYTSPRELEEMREAQAARGLPIRYDGRHRDLTDKDRARFEAEGRQPVVRMRLPERDERIVVDDLIRGKVVFDSGQLDDQVILKSDGFPTYHLAVVVDDEAMGITHILRAEEWLPSTPKHLYLYRWLGWEPPRFAHLPLLLNEDRSKMSKRSGDIAAQDYRAKGYLPDALMNFLALLGWNPGDEQELFSRPELVRRFSLDRVGRSGSVFDRKKLDWMNQIHIGRLSPDALYTALRPYIDKTPYAGADETTLRKICTTVQPSLVTLADIQHKVAFFFRPDDTPLTPEVAQGIASEQARTVIGAFRERLEALHTLDEQAFRALMKEVQTDTRIKGKQLWGPMRWAITLEADGPDLSQVAEVFGREKTLQRLSRALGG